MRKFMIIFVLCILCFSFILGSQAEVVAQRKFVRFGGSNPGGSWFTIVGGLSAFLSGKIGDLNVTAIATGGSVDNNRLASKGELDTWLTHSLTAYDIWNGVGTFQGEEPFKAYRMISGVYDNHHHFVVLADSDIKIFSDLKGKKVCIGSAGSGGAINSENILRALGLWDQIEVSTLTWEAGATALTDGQIDCVGLASAPAPAGVTIEATHDIRLLEFNDEEFDKVISEFPSYSKGIIPAGAYESIDRDIPAIVFPVFWAAHADTDPESVYKMMKVAFDPENAESLAAIYVHLTTLGDYFEAMKLLKIPLHSGAVKFWEEQGLDIPPELIPPEL